MDILEERESRIKREVETEFKIEVSNLKNHQKKLQRRLDESDEQVFNQIKSKLEGKCNDLILDNEKLR